MTRFERDGKHPIEVGDLVHVEGNPDSRVTTQGWYNGRVLRFWTDAVGNFVADVTKPHSAGCRVVAATRLTKQHTVR